jgi:hypothetical protein
MRLSFIDIAKNLRKTTRNSNSTVLAWATMGDATQKGLGPCRVAKGRQGKYSMHNFVLHYCSCCVLFPPKNFINHFS